MAIHNARGVSALTKLACGASLAVLAVSPAWAQDAETATDAAADEAAPAEGEIVVTGFR